MPACHRANFLFALPRETYDAIVADVASPRVTVLDGDDDVVVVNYPIDAEPSPWPAVAFDDLLYSLDPVLDARRADDPVLDSLVTASEENWYPVCVIDSTAGIDRPLRRSGPAASYTEWDGAVVVADDAEVEPRLIALTASLLARWHCLQTAVRRARGVITDTSESAIDRMDAERDASKIAIARALVVFDKRTELYYAYEFLYYEQLAEAWNMPLMDQAATTALASLSEILELRSRQLSRTATRMTALWLFIISVASGLSVVLSATDFLANHEPLGVASLARFGILAAMTVFTSSLAVVYRRTRAA